MSGYEIHTGQVIWRGQATVAGSAQPASPVAGRPFRLRESRMAGESPAADYAPEGCADEAGRVRGTFLHGILHNDDFRRGWLNRLRMARGLEPLVSGIRVGELRERAFARLADHVRQHVDIDRLKRIVGLTS